MNTKTNIEEISLKADRNFFIIAILIGIFLNFAVMSLNDNRMPVRTEYYINSATYFDFQENSEVLLPLASDYYGFNFGGYEIRFSVGDFLMIFSFIGFLMVTIKLTIIQWSLRKSQKNY